MCFFTHISATIFLSNSHPSPTPEYFDSILLSIKELYRVPTLNDDLTYFNYLKTQQKKTIFPNSIHLYETAASFPSISSRSLSFIPPTHHQCHHASFTQPYLLNIIPLSESLECRILQGSFVLLQIIVISVYLMILYREVQFKSQPKTK